MHTLVNLSGDKKTEAAAARVRDFGRRLASLRQTPGADPKAVAALKAKYEEAQAELAKVAGAAAMKAAPPTAAELAKALPEGVVLVDYLFGAGRLTAFIHRNGAAAVPVNLGEAKGIREEVAAWRSKLMKRSGDKEAGKQVKKMVWEKLEPHLKDATVILISPDGPLAGIPFAALPGKKEGTYLIEDVALAVAAVPQAIPDLLKPVKTGDDAKSLLLAGGIRYEPKEGDTPVAAADETLGAARSKDSWTYLNGTKTEVDAIHGSAKGLFADKGTINLLTEHAATKSAISKGLRSVRFAHIATHGFFASEDVSKGEWPPMLLSGLALSNANRDPKPGEEDGILTALEVSELDLSKLDLVVLSACQTGLGQVAGGEGVLGLQRAFQTAGARSVISSLWCVDDEATKSLMTLFYEKAWSPKEKLSRAEAMRKAQVILLHEGFKRGLIRGMSREDGKPTEEKVGKEGKDASPYSWAPFILSGDWR
jgi:CHAT domain-containing protein